jgi:hypothetical protein
VLEQLPGAETEQGAVHRRQSVQGPVVGALRDQPVDLLGAAGDALDGFAGELGRDRLLLQQVGRRYAAGLGFVEQSQGPLPAVSVGVGPRVVAQARVRYSPVRVSTLMRSP